LKLESVSKSYAAEAGLKINVLEDISFEIPYSYTGKIITMLAPFGSGKSTLLKIISGIIDQTSGKICFNDSYQKKRIPLIPEKPSSFPWLSVAQNIELVLKSYDINKYNAADLISIVGLNGYEEHFPDNKFKHMKKESREEIYNLVEEISTKVKQNFILATTNLVEAIQLSNKIFLLSQKPGKIIRTIEIDRKNSAQMKDHKSEKFTLYKTEIEQAFESIESLTTINYSV
jgi:ABC-type nitrate/sulfonate/bicarbonate transport system ATPase subunit